MKEFFAWLDRTLDRFDPKVLIALTIIGYFGLAYQADPKDDTLKGALIAAFAGAWGFYLGSSSGAAQANKRADRAIDLAQNAVEKKE